MNATLEESAVRAALDVTGDEYAALSVGPHGQPTITVASAGSYGVFAAALAAWPVIDAIDDSADAAGPVRAAWAVLEALARVSTEWLPQRGGEPPLLAVTFHELAVTPGAGRQRPRRRPAAGATPPAPDPAGPGGSVSAGITPCPDPGRHSAHPHQGGERWCEGRLDEAAR